MNNLKENTNVYAVSLYVKCSEEQSHSLKKSLAQTIHDGFEMTSENAVFGVTVEIDVPPEHDYVMALYIVGLEDGLDPAQIKKLLLELPDKGQYIPIEFTGENSTAVGFINVEYFEECDYQSEKLEAGCAIVNILNDMDLESPAGIYDTPDGRKFYMGYYKK